MDRTQLFSPELARVLCLVLLLLVGLPTNSFAHNVASIAQFDFTIGATPDERTVTVGGNATFVLAVNPHMEIVAQTQKAIFNYMVTGKWIDPATIGPDFLPSSSYYKYVETPQPHVYPLITCPYCLKDLPFREQVKWVCYVGVSSTPPFMLPTLVNSYIKSVYDQGGLDAEGYRKLINQPCPGEFSAIGASLWGIMDAEESARNTVIRLSLSNAPSGVIATFDPASGKGNFSSTLTLSTASTLSPGQYSLIITGIGGGTARTFTVTLNVQSVAPVSTEEATTTFGDGGILGFPFLLVAAVVIIAVVVVAFLRKNEQEQKKPQRKTYGTMKKKKSKA